MPLSFFYKKMKNNLHYCGELGKIVVLGGRKWKEFIILVMFMGEFNHSVDAKGRVIVPSKFRDKLGESFVITKGFDRCLSIYDIENWTGVQEKLSMMPMLTEDARTIRRMMVGSATEAEFDKQGRVLLPAPLREYAGISKDAVMIGNIDHIEIWSKDAWNKAQNIDADAAAEKLYDSGIIL